MDFLVDVFVKYKDIGQKLAWEKWKKCFDPDTKLGNTKNAIANTVQAKHSLEKQIRYLITFLEPEQINLIRTSGTELLKQYQEECESKIERERRPVELNYNKQAVINTTDIVVPEDILINLSFGYKFLAPYFCNDSNMHIVLAQLEQCIGDSIKDVRHLEACIEIQQILLDRDIIQHDDTKKWLSFTSQRAIEFFTQHKELIATKSDKGGHTVIMRVEDYDQKLNNLISEGNYSWIPLLDPTKEMIEKEQELIRNVWDIEKCKAFIKKQDKRPKGYEPNTLQLPKFYGLPKIHKTGTPMRPITSTKGAPGHHISKTFNLLVNEVFPVTDWHIRDSYHFAKYMKGIEINENDRLVSFDVVSMFSSIPYELVAQILMSRAELFEERFNINQEKLDEIIKYCLKDCMFFTTPDGTIYKQEDGLPMGSCLSPTMARIVMDVIINKLTQTVEGIRFVRVFVDDTILAINKDKINLALNTLNDFHPNIKFTCEMEDDDGKINFLNTTLIRENNSVKLNWYRKNFASGRLLNYFSSHKRTTVMATAVHFIETVLDISDPSFFHHNRETVIETLRMNSFPEIIIISLMHKHYTFMRDTKYKPNLSGQTGGASQTMQTPSSGTTISSQTNETMDPEPTKYTLFPRSICKGRQIKRVIHTLKKDNVILADSTRNSRLNPIKLRKTKTATPKKGNLVLIADCTCGEKKAIIATRYNETGDMALNRLKGKNTCDQHSHAYTDAKFHRGLYYCSQTQLLAKYIKWKYRSKLDYKKSPFDPPFRKLRSILRK